MAEMILKEPLLKDLKGIKEVLVGQGDPILAAILNRAIACVEKQPVADAAPVVHGRWMTEENGNFCNVKCSACGKDFACHYGMLQLQNFRYCPNCGAKMDGGRKNNGH